MNDEMDEEMIDEVVLQPNDFAYRKYQKFTGLFIAGVNERIDKDDPDFGTTDIALPDGHLNYRFDEGVQGWRGMTSDELDVYLASIRIPASTSEDEWKMSMIKQNALFIQQNMALVQTTANLTARLTKIEKEQTEDTNNG